MLFDEHFLKTALPDAVIVGTVPTNLACSIDSRTIKPGEIFFALQGARVDGHNFIKDALINGAVGIVIAKGKRQLYDALPESLTKDKLLVLVHDTTQALIVLAKAWRNQFTIPVVAITGSIGKTSTKQMVANILASAGVNYIMSEGNQNTKIGIALNMVKMRNEHQVALFELGINKRGEMAQLADMLRPTIPVITYIGHSHMEGLGALSDIAQEKRAIFNHCTQENVGVINGDQQILAQGYVSPVIKFGSKTINQIQARKIRVHNNAVHFILKIYKEKAAIVLNDTHKGKIFNALAATAVARLLNISTAAIIQGIQIPLEVKGRFQHYQLPQNKGIIIDDCYNASPESMKAALLAFEQIKSTDPKIGVLGDMLELGVNSPFWHRQLGRFLRKVPSMKKVILVGDLVKWTKKTAPLNVSIELVPTWQAAITKLETMLSPKAMILVKASRGIELNNLVDHFAAKSKRNTQ